MRTESISTILGPLASLYDDPKIIQIIVDAPDRIYFRESGEWDLSEAEITFDSPEAIREVVDTVMGIGGLTLTPENTTGQIRLVDGSSVMAVIPPTAIGSPYLVIQKVDQSRWDTFNWEHLLEIGTLTQEAYDLLTNALDLYINILVAGNHNSGKNYITNLLAETLPKAQRLVVVADPYELPVRHPHRIHLEVNGSAKVSFTHLLDIAAQMRPNWLVIGDMDGPEAMRAVQLMNNGQLTLSTLHADGPEEALERLESMCLMANPSLSLDEIRRMIASAIGLIAYQQNHTLPDYRIKITRIVQVQGVENGRYIIQPLLTYDLEQGQLIPTKAYETWREKMRARLIHG